MYLEINFRYPNKTLRYIVVFLAVISVREKAKNEAGIVS